MSLLGRALSPRAVRNAFAGAQAGRLNDFIFSSIQSPNQEVRGDLRTLRARSRELCRNNPHAKRFLRLLSQNVIGPNGIRLESQVMLKTGKNAGQPDEAVNDVIEAAWGDWGRPATCDVAKKKSWTTMQGLILQTIARDGEAFVRVIEGFRNEYGFALQLLDADQIDETYTVPGTTTSNQVEMGVEIDSWGAPVAYWLWNQHPGDGGRDRKREPIPASQIIHLFIEERAGQVRGTPWLSVVLIALRMIAGYSEAEVVAARTAAAKMGFIVPGEDDPGPDPDQPAYAQSSPMEATPGVIERLNKGETFAEWDPSHPSGNYGPFMVAQHRDVAIGMNVAYTSLTGDLSNANYSSARVGLLDERDGWRMLQTWTIEHLHDPIYRRWLRVASLSPRLTLASYDFTKYEACAWRPRGWDWVDPLNDLTAISIAIGLGLTSASEVAAGRGSEFIDNIKARRRELDIAASYGVTLTDAKGVVVQPQAAAPSDQSNPDQPAGDAGRLTATPAIGGRVAFTLNGNGNGNGHHRKD